MDSGIGAELLAAARSNPAFMAELRSAASPEEFVRIADRYGFRLAGSELAASGSAESQLSDEELDGVSGGTLLHLTVSVLCSTSDNFCTFNPYACSQSG